MTEPSSGVILPEPPDELKQLSRRLAAQIRSDIGQNGTMPFSRYMEMALYEPGLGYYSAGLHKLGATGDFTTAPELGGMFAACLARQIDEIGQALGHYQVLEIGAGTGRLAAALLNALEDGTRRDGAAPTRYAILERSADLRQVQKETLAQHAPQSAHRVVWLDQPPGDEWNGVLLANEVIDALPIERFEYDNGSLSAMGVRDGADNDAGDGDSDFAWQRAEPGNALRQAIATIPASIRETWPGQYRSEINPALTPWLQSLTSRLHTGIALFIDYGYPRHEYYLPERNDGTLLCHYRHRAHDNPFLWPGLQDITASVDFTALAEAGETAGLSLGGYTNQAMFLLGCGLEQIMQTFQDLPEKEYLQKTAEVRQLTLPGLMGERFQVMGLCRNFEKPLRGFSLLDLSYRLSY